MIHLSEATRRNTRCLDLNIFGVATLVSYTTVVAASYRNERIRRINTWGPTTKRHMQEGGVYDWPQVDKEQFEETLNRMVLTAIRDRAVHRLAA